MKYALNKLSWQNSWIKALKWSMLKWGNHRHPSLEMEICANECHVNLFTNGRLQPNLCNIVHHFMGGNCRSTHSGLDLMLKGSLKRFVIWIQIDKNKNDNKNDNLNTMHESVADCAHVMTLIKPSLTNKINEREISINGIDYS